MKKNNQKWKKPRVFFIFLRFFFDFSSFVLHFFFVFLRFFHLRRFCNWCLAKFWRKITKNEKNLEFSSFFLRFRKCYNWCLAKMKKTSSFLRFFFVFSSFFLRFFFIFEDFAIDVLPKWRKITKNQENLEFSSLFSSFFFVFSWFFLHVFTFSSFSKILQWMSCQNEEKWRKNGEILKSHEEKMKSPNEEKMKKKWTKKINHSPQAEAMGFS